MNQTIASRPGHRSGLDPTSCDDRHLLRLVRGGDDQGFAEIYRRFEPNARRYARRLVAPTDVDDVVSEAFTKVLQAIDSGHGPYDNTVSYLMVAVRTTAGDLHKRRAREAEKAALLGRSEADDREELLMEDDRLVEAFRALSPRRREVIWWSEVDGLSASEIGERLGMSANAASALCYRARRALREAYLEVVSQSDDLLTAVAG